MKLSIMKSIPTFYKWGTLVLSFLQMIVAMKVEMEEDEKKKE